MSKHTPGPWRSSGRWVVAGKGDDAEFIAETDAPRFDFARYERACEDARLIAAAPEMLEALEDLTAAAPNDPCWQRARAAIAKARGAR